MAVNHIEVNRPERFRAKYAPKRPVGEPEGLLSVCELGGVDDKIE